MGLKTEKIEEIIEQCRQGNNKAQKYLFELYSNKMMALCYRYLKDKFDAEDALIEGFMKIFSSISSFKGNNLSPWIAKIMINVCLHHIRDNKKMIKQDISEQILIIDKEVFVNYERFNREDLKKALFNLTDFKRTVFNLSVIDGYSHKEISEMLNISTDVVKTTIYRAKQQLKSELLNIESKRRECK